MILWNGPAGATLPGSIRPPVVEIFTVAALVFLVGCLPSSCQRIESTRILPSDSLSRGVAASAVVDTLQLVWSTSGLAPHRFEFPRTVRFGRGDTIYVADVERNSLFVVSGDQVVTEMGLGGVEVPYLAGVTGDTISLFSPASLTYYRLHAGRLLDSVSVEDAGRERTSLVYGAAGEHLYYKRVDPEYDGFIVTLRRDGSAIDTTHLKGPQWRYAGLLKMWGDTLVSLSGFRPVVDLVAPTERRRMRSDTLALVGFDSPMLARSRSFMKGDVHEAPLLSSSAAPAGDRLFVLNMRAGWLHVDVFGRNGVLQRQLIGHGVDYRSAFFPQDLDVRRTSRGFEIAVVYSEPEPALKLYLWKPSGSFWKSADMNVAGDAVSRP